MPVGKGWDRKLRERRIFTAHQAGLTDEEIAQNMRLNPRTVRRILARVGVDTEAISKQERKQMPKKKQGVSRRDFEQLEREVNELTAMSCAREFRRMIDDGEPERIAAERGIPYQDAWSVCLEEAYRPDTEATQARQEAKQRAAARTLEVDEEALDRKATAYADKHGVGYEVALEAVLDTVPGSRRPVELAEPEKLKVDSDEEELNRKAEARVRREGVSYEIALEAVLTEGR